MNKPVDDCECVIDVYGLCAVCLLSPEAKERALSAIESGKVRCLARAWREFKELYPEDAGEIEKVDPKKITLRDKHHQCAATIAEQTNSGFLIRPYDSYTDWYTASVCKTEGFTLLTSDENYDFYTDLGACVVQKIADYFSS